MKACPNEKNHTKGPTGYIQWHVWADKMAKTHKQRRCPDCKRWAIWEPRRLGR